MQRRTGDIYINSLDYRDRDIFFDLEKIKNYVNNNTQIRLLNVTIKGGVEITLKGELKLADS